MLNGNPTLDITMTYAWPEVAWPAPPPGRYFRVLRDYETNEWGGGVRESVSESHKGMPATIKTRDDTFISMPREFQFWFWEVWNLFAPASMTEAQRKSQWAGYWHSNLAWTNFQHGSDYCADYINGTNLTSLPMARETLWARGNIVKLQDGFTNLDDKWWPMDAITSDVSTLPSPEAFARMWWLCGLATVQNPTRFDDGTYQVDRFPHLRDPNTGVGNDVPMPMLSRDGVLYFDKLRLREVTPGVHLNPYNPVKTFSPQF